MALGVIGGGSVVKEHGNFRFNLGPGEDQIYHEITAVGMRNVTTDLENMSWKKSYKNSDLLQTLLRRVISYQRLWVELRC